MPINAYSFRSDSAPIRGSIFASQPGVDARASGYCHRAPILPYTPRPFHRALRAIARDEDGG